jgi:hypothetical protein
MGKEGHGKKGDPPSEPRIRIRIADDLDTDFDDDDAELPPLRPPPGQRSLARPVAEERPLPRDEAKQYVSPLETDPWLYRIAVTALALVVVGSPFIYYSLQMAGKPAPEGLLAVVSAAVTALVLLVKKG